MHKREILIIVAVGIITFNTVLLNGFVGDDYFLFVDNTFYRTPDNISRLFSRSHLTENDTYYLDRDQHKGSGAVSYRPVLTLSFFLDSFLWKLKPVGFHLTNVFLHILNSVLVYIFVFFVLQRSSVALFAALLFCVHPLKVEAVNAIGYRADTLSVFFILLSVICYLYRKSGGLSSLKRNLFLAASLGAYSLAVFTKESAIIVPAVVVLYDIWRTKRLSFKSLKENIPAYMGYVIISAGYLYIYVCVFPNTTFDNIGIYNGSWVWHIVFVFRLFFENVMSFFMPFGMSIVPPFYKPVLTGIGDVRAVIGCVLFALAVVFAVRGIRNRKHAAFFLVLFFVSYAPVAYVIPIATAFAHRFMYFPSVGLSVVVALAVARMCEVLRARNWYHYDWEKAMHLCIVGVCMINTIPANRYWKDNFSASSSMISGYPASHIGYYHYASASFREGKFHQAKKYIEQSISLGSQDCRAYYMAGFLNARNKKRAKKYFKQAIRLSNDYALSYIGLGRLYFFEGNFDAAREYLRKSISIQPMYSAFGYLMQIEILSGNMDGARDVLKRAKAVIHQDEQIRSLYNFINLPEGVTLPVDIGI